MPNAAQTEAALVALARFQSNQEAERRRLNAVVEEQLSQIVALTEQHTKDETSLKELSLELAAVSEEFRGHLEHSENQLRQLFLENGALQHKLRLAERPNAVVAEARCRSNFSSQFPQELLTGHNDLEAERIPVNSHLAEPQPLRSTSTQTTDTPLSTERDELPQREAGGELQEDCSRRSSTVGSAEDRQREAPASEVVEPVKAEQPQRPLSSENSMLLAEMMKENVLQNTELGKLRAKMAQLEASLREAADDAEEQRFKATQQLHEAEVQRGRLEFELRLMKVKLQQHEPASVPVGCYRPRRVSVAVGTEASASGEATPHSTSRPDSGTPLATSGRGSAMTELRWEQSVRHEEQARILASLLPERAGELERIKILEIRDSELEVELLQARASLSTKAAQLSALQATCDTMERSLREEMKRSRDAAAAHAAEQQKLQQSLDDARWEAQQARKQLEGVAHAKDEEFEVERAQLISERSALQAQLLAASIPQRLTSEKSAVLESRVAELEAMIRKRDQDLHDAAREMRQLVEQRDRAEQRVIALKDEVALVHRQLTSSEDSLRVSEDARRHQVLELSTHLRRTAEKQAAGEYTAQRGVVSERAYRDLQRELAESRRHVDDAARITELASQELASLSIMSGSGTPNNAAIPPVPGSDTAVLLSNPSSCAASPAALTPRGIPLAAMMTPMTAEKVRQEKSTSMAARRLVQLTKQVLNSTRSSHRGPGPAFSSPLADDVQQTVRRNAMRLEMSAAAESEKRGAAADENVSFTGSAHAGNLTHDDHPRERRLTFDDGSPSPSSPEPAVAVAVAGSVAAADSA